MPRNDITTEAALRSVNMGQANEIIKLNADNRKLVAENVVLRRRIQVTLLLLGISCALSIASLIISFTR